jgi:hypothetical protein
LPQGYNSYIEISEEGTQMGTEQYVWGVDSGLFRCGMYFDSESMSPANEAKFLTEIGRSGIQDRGVKRYRQMGLKAEGSLEFVTYPESGGDKGGLGLLLKHVFCAVTTGTYSGAGTYLHTFTPQDNMFVNLTAGTGLGVGTGHVFGLSFNIGREDTSGTIRNYPFLGNRIKSLTFACAAGEEMKCTVDSVSRIAKAHGTARVPIFPTMAPFMWKDATFQLGVAENGSGGTERNTVESFSIVIDNNLKEVWTLGTNVLGRVVPNGQRKVTGAYTVPYDTWVRAEYDKWVAGTPSSLNMAFVNSPYRLEFRCPNIYYTGKAPNISKMDETIVEMPFTCLVSTTFDLRVFLVNTDSCIGFGLN